MSFITCFSVRIRKETESGLVYLSFFLQQSNILYLFSFWCFLCCQSLICGSLRVTEVVGAEDSRVLLDAAGHLSLHPPLPLLHLSHPLLFPLYHPNLPSTIYSLPPLSSLTQSLIHQHCSLAGHLSTIPPPSSDHPSHLHWCGRTRES